MIGIRDNDGRTPFDRVGHGITKPNLVVPTEQILIIFDEAIHVVANGIGRIDKQKIPLLRL